MKEAQRLADIMRMVELADEPEKRKGKAMRFVERIENRKALLPDASILKGRMARASKMILALLVVGLFFAEMPMAHAVFGIRAARSVIAARRAKQAMAKTPDSTPPATETPAEKLQRLEAESTGE